MSEQRELGEYEGIEKNDIQDIEDQDESIALETGFEGFKKPNGEAKIIRASWAGAVLPDGWSTNVVGDHVEVQGGKAFSSDNFSKQTNEGLPLVKRKTVNNDTYPETRITKDVEGRYIVQDGDVLVSMDRYFECILWSYGDAGLNQRVCRLTPTSEFNKYYLMYALQKPLTYLEDLGGTTDFTSLSINEFDNIEIPTPPIPEQEKIATVLHNVDELYDKNQEIIEQAKSTKRALIEKLLTLGIDHKSYKPFEIGPREYEIPEGWKIVTFGDIFDTHRGVNYSSDNYVESPEEGMLFLTLNAISPGGGIKRGGLKYYDDEVKDKKIASHNDILIANTDLNQDGKIIGYPVSVPDFDGQVSFSHHLLKLSQTDDVFRQDFLKHLLSAEYIHKRMKDISCGSTVLNLDTSLLQKIPLPVPPKSEQQEIANILEECDNLIENHEDRQNNLNNIKNGLMQDLLTGTVRTTDTNIQVPDEIAQHG
ncbi:restriction endonuclease subunit S [Haloarcula argentinensis]|uniref:Type I restriction modification DNA specificity domain-containing protein n=1 Tax=Haloarcula argentinensis TaxID=43776 RepID=A0A847UKJ1_HALAR|nr:restriction endonuclease subunit S [Haloarcula argentinensis]NLV12204.1 hypothetical protein [Haloarcula argentinensis]